MSFNNNLPTIAIAGASGFVGGALIDKLEGQANLIALSRSRPKEREEGANLEWRQCDLFSLLQLEQALIGADVAIYLIHSMLPSAALVQASFNDLDLILADNFARAAKRVGVKHIVYLSGLLPVREREDQLSEHLKSRYEVEEVLKASGIPVVSCRAGIILGPGGSSLEIMKRLVERLPVLICPRWTQSRSSAVSLERVLAAIAEMALAKPSIHHTYDLAQSYLISYQDMMKETARALGLKRRFITLGTFSPRLSRLWVSLVTGAPKGLVYPLIMSLGHNLIPRQDHQLAHYQMDCPFGELVLAAMAAPEAPHAFKKGFARAQSVRSVQRLPLGERTLKGREVGELYLSWLGRSFLPFFKVRTKDHAAGFYLWGIKRALLILALSRVRSSEDRVLFYIKGGLLSRRVEGRRGRLEFRNIPCRKVVLAAIHDFYPRLPWQIYRLTQAPFHLWVMKSFGRFLAQKEIGIERI